MEVKFTGPIPTGTDLWVKLIELIAEQEGVTIEYELTSGRKGVANG
jgi:hypothetical protein